MNNIICGVALLAIGFFSGGSVFTGNPELYDWFFDILGVGLILYGLYTILGNKDTQKE